MDTRSQHIEASGTVPAPSTTLAVPVMSPPQLCPESSAQIRKIVPRPKSAIHTHAAAAKRNLLLRRPDNDRSTTTIPSSLPSARRTLTKPRPPSASAALCSTTGRRIRPHSSSPAKGTNVLSYQIHEARNSAGDMISPGIMREEIETQRKVTRRAQRELNTLRVQQAQKEQEIELLDKHLRAFDVESYPSPHKTAVATTTTTCSSIVSGTPTHVEQFKDEIRRLDVYKKTLRHMQDRLARHLQFIKANVELLEAKRGASAREHVIFQDKVAQERSLGAELEFKRNVLLDERVVHTQHARQLLDSLRTEIQSRSFVHQQRDEADRRREEMLRLVESRPAGGSSSQLKHDNPEIHRSSSSKELVSALQKRGSHGRRDSFRMLLQESMQFFGTSEPVTLSSRSGSLDGCAASLAVAAATSSRHLHIPRQHPPSMGIEAFYQVYETQYERILTQTGESDLAIVLERFKNFGETMKRLRQIEKDLLVEHSTLENLRVVHTEHVTQLRLSGIAEVEKRKKIRDFLEQQFQVKSQQRTQANELFVEQLKTFSYVQQGILNIAELLKCLDEKFTPPSLAPLPGSSGSSGISVTSGSSAASGLPVGVLTGSIVHHSVTTAAAVAEIEWLQSLLLACRSVMRNNPVPSTACGGTFTLEQIAQLGKIDPSLGAAVNKFVWQQQQQRRRSTMDSPTDPFTRDYDSETNKTSKDHRDSDGDDVDKDDDSEDDSEEDSEDDSDGGVDSRQRIKRDERETLQQVELLFRTLDSRQQNGPRPGQSSMHRLRCAFGLSRVGEHDHHQSDEDDDDCDTAEATKMKGESDPAAAKLRAVHSFFREKRLREKKYESRAPVVAAVSVSSRHRNSIRVPLSSCAMRGAGGATGLMMDKTTAASTMALAAFRPAMGDARQPLARKRSNAVSFAAMANLQTPQNVPSQGQSQQQQQQQQQQRQLGMSSVEDTRSGTATSTAVVVATSSGAVSSPSTAAKKPTRPATASSVAAHRRPVQQVPTQTSTLTIRRPQAPQQKKR